MTNRFVCSGVTQKPIRFKVQIGDYSKYACKGYYTSPEFGDDDCESKWSLLVHVYDGADHENFIDVRLQRHDYETDVQTVSVKTSIVNCFGFNALKNERKILFEGSNEARILSVAKTQLKGLKNKFYLPKDTLTLQCDLLIHKSSVSAYTNEESFLNNKSRSDNDISEYFARSRLMIKAEDYFVRKITDFSVQSYGGRTITPKFKSENLGGSWYFVVCNTTDYNSLECLDICLMREESYEHQLVKVNLSIIDPLNKEILSKEKFAYFSSSREVQLLSPTETVISSWYGLRKKQLTPDDTLTLRCKMVLYEQIDDTFDRKEDFNNGVKTSGYAPMQLSPYLVAICFVLPIILHIFYCLCLATPSFIWYTILYIFPTTIWYTILYIFPTIIWAKSILFILVVYAIAIMFCYFKLKAAAIKRREKAREINMKLQEGKEKMMLDNCHEYGIDSYRKNDFQNRRKLNFSNHENTLYYN